MGSNGRRVDSERAYAIVGADTRVTYYGADPEDVWWRDDKEKIGTTKLGLISGAGAGAVLDRVKARLVQEDLQDTEEIRGIICQECAIGLDRMMQPRLRKLTQATTWLFTFVGLGSLDPRDSDVHSPGLRLATLAPGINSDFALALPGTCNILWPYDLTRDQARPVYQHCNERSRIHDPARETLLENVAHHAAVIMNAIREVSRISASVSSRCQLGIHTIEHGTLISAIVDDDGDSVSFEWT
jgi:hypothetical protein